ncbi:hypothetical protein ACFQ2M_38750 [Kitasatospora saccharophila]|uniref:hypothetical protein n=1 Tax=Kitasatospora saccharophila TaxID=407973 RepID=UPI00363313E4
MLVDYLRHEAPGQAGFKVTGIALTPPGGTGRLTFHWEGANPRTDGGTYVHPVTG